jgi:hypothetical protein
MPLWDLLLIGAACLEAADSGHDHKHTIDFWASRYVPEAASMLRVSLSKHVAARAGLCKKQAFHHGFAKGQSRPHAALSDRAKSARKRMESEAGGMYY